MAFMMKWKLYNWIIYKNLLNGISEAFKKEDYMFLHKIFWKNNQVRIVKSIKLDNEMISRQVSKGKIDIQNLKEIWIMEKKIKWLRKMKRRGVE